MRRVTVGGLIALCSIGTSACITNNRSELEKGIDAYLRADYSAADTTFSSELASHPDDPYAQFNLADTYLAQSRRDEAIVLYRKATVTGHGVVPRKSWEGRPKGETIQDHACSRLGTLGVQDEHCAAG
jgi:hypothetical protein